MQSNHKVESHYFIWQLSAVTASYCTRSPYARFVPCLAQYNRWDFFGIWRGFINSDKVICWLHLIFYYHHLPVYGVQLTYWELYCTFINHCLLIRSLAHFDTHPPRQLMTNHMHVLVMTAHGGINLNITNCNRFLDGSECSILVKVLSWMRASNSHFSEWTLLFCHLAFKVSLFQVTAPEPHGKLWVLHWVPMHFRK
jgi:hypothetical protein